MPSRVGSKGKTWKARVQVPGGGERTKRFKTKREAQDWEATQRKAPIQSRSTLTEILEQHQDDALADLSPATLATYRSNITRRILVDFGDRRLPEVCTSMTCGLPRS